MTTESWAIAPKDAPDTSARRMEYERDFLHDAINARSDAAKDLTNEALRECEYAEGSPRWSLSLVRAAWASTDPMPKAIAKRWLDEAAKAYADDKMERAQEANTDLDARHEYEPERRAE